MGKYKSVFVILVICQTIGGNKHEPPPGAPVFQRSAVEQIPILDRKASYVVEELGTRSLPLRAAVENIPDITKTLKRLPLRDAVEQRPTPDLSEEEDIEDIPVLRSDLNKKFPIKYGLDGNVLRALPANYKTNSYYIPNNQLQYSNNLPSFSSNYQQPQYFGVSYYSPIQIFRTLLSDYRKASPYRIDNGYHQLLVHPNQWVQESFEARPQSRIKSGKVLSHDNDGQRIICYVQGQAVYRREPQTFRPEDLNPFACTHVIYAFAAMDPHSFQITPNDEEYDLIQGGYTAVTGLKRLNPKLKVMISVGGGEQSAPHRFASMVSSATKRRNFIRSVIQFMKVHNFDGLDIHWQYPGDEELGGHTSDKEYLVLLLEELNELFRPREWLLSIAVPASRFRIEDGFRPDRLANLVDFVNLQAYNFHRDKDPGAEHHANLNVRPDDQDLDTFFNVDYAVKYWLKKGLPRSKLVVGIPFFGRSFTLLNSNETLMGSPIKGPGNEGYYTQTKGFLAYFEVCDLMMHEGWELHSDSSGAPYIVNGDQWVAFDNTDSIKKKITYVKDLELGGIFVWSADMDDFKGLCGEKWPLLGAVNQFLKRHTLEEIDYSMPSRPFGTCEKSGIYSDPNNCAAYYICRHGLNYHLSCPSNTIFDTESGICGNYPSTKCRPGESLFISSTIRRNNFFPNALMRSSQINNNKPKVVCYLTNWAFYRKSSGKFVPENVDQQLCTYVVYAFASLDPESLIMKAFDPWADFDNNLYQRVTSLKDTIPLLSLGGWTDSSGGKYSKLVSSASSRRKFVIAALDFLKKYGFKGLHFDWNYPVCWQSNCNKGPATDKPNFSKLISELRTEFDKVDPPLVLAAAISGYKEVIDVAYDLPNLGKNLDFLSVMTYDYHGAWEGQTGHVSPLFHRPGDRYSQYNSNFTMEYLASKGAPRRKLLMGIPFYGQTFTLAQAGDYAQGAQSIGPGEPGEYTKQPGMLAYYEICNRIRNKRWIITKEPTGTTGPYAYKKNQWVGFENPQSVREKAKYIKLSGFGGAVAWTIDLDDFSNTCCEGTFPLLTTLNRELGLISDRPVQEDCTQPTPPSTPPPPITTTGVDSGAEYTTSHNHEGHYTTSKKPVTWWSTTMSPTTQKTTTRSTTQWWQTSHSSQTWWTTSSTTSRPTTTRRTTTSTTTTEATASTTLPTPVIVMPDMEHPAEPCQSGQYLSDPANCNAYFRCILGELKRQYCAGGLHWNRERGICDWPASAKCKEEGSQRPITTKRPTTERTTTTTMSWWNPPSTTQSWWQTSQNYWETTKATQNWWTTTTRKPVFSTEASLQEISEIPCMNGQYYPHESCNSFYVCDNNQLVVQSCAPGLNWNMDSQMCDWPFKVKCANRKKYAQPFTNLENLMNKISPDPYSTCAGNSFAPLKGDCNKYMHCLWGKYEIYDCAPGLHWNNDKQLCDWPDNANCQADNDIDDSQPGEKPVIPVDPIYKPTMPTEKPTSGFYPDWKPTLPATTSTQAPEVQELLKPQSGYFKIVCYFTNWAWYRQGVGKYLPEDINPDLCTHIVYGFAVLDYENLIIKAHDSWADFDNKFYERVVAYKAKGLKVSLAIGGWNDSQGDKYSRLVNNPAARARFIKHVLEFLEKHNFDGLDLDWEYPKCWQVDCNKGPDSDKAAFADWVRELKQAFRPKGLLLSAAVSPSKTVIDAGYAVEAIGRDLDWVAVMTYDYHGQWDKKTGHVAPLYYHPEDDVAYFNANYTINYWISEGVSRRKIVMGMPLYGQSFQLAKESENGLNAMAPGPGQAGQFTRANGFLAYYEICDNIKNKGWTVVQDPKRRIGPYAYKGNQWVSFDDKEMIRLKSEFIRDMDLGGGMIWALDLDDFKNRCGEGVHPLLTTIRQVLADPGSGTPVPVPVIPIEPELPEFPQEGPTDSPNSPSVITPIVEPITSTVTSVTTTDATVDRDSEYKVVCYFTNWAWYRQGVGKYLPSDIDPDLCTHIVYGFAVLNGDQLIIKPHDSWADFDNKFYEKVTALKSKGIKVLIAIGGWNDSAGDKYSKLVNNPSARRRFISHVVDFIEENNFDGLDLDWEYPKCWQVDCNKGPASDKQGFSDFVRELHAAFQPKGWLLSAAVSPNKRVIDEGYDVPTLSRYLDWIAVMCYDYHGQWDKITGHVAPMYEHPEDSEATLNSNFTINYWIEKGADRKKLVMGMPMYGQSFSLADNSNNGLNAPTYGGGEAGEETRARGFLSYYEICTNVINKGWTVVRDKKGRIGPYAYLRDQWVSFDDIGMIRHKSQYIKAMGLGGGMIWALDLDDFKNLCGCEEYPLLRTINRVLRNYSKPAPKCVLGKGQPENKMTTMMTPSSKKPTYPTYQPTESPQPSYPKEMPCNGNLFMADDSNCQNYYICNQGKLQLQVCPHGLYWNKDHCDWPENTACHPDATTTQSSAIEASTMPSIEYAPSTVEIPEAPYVPGTVSQYPDEGGMKVVCYFTNWAWYRQGDGKYLPDDIDPSLCTHITYGFAVLDSSTLTIKPHDSWADIDNNFYTKVVAYKAKGLKVLIALGGWNDSLGDKYSRLVNNPEARARFVEQALKFIEKWGFDGLDLDWEYPKCWQVDCNKGPSSDKEGFASLVRELSAQFKPRGLLLSSAVSPSKMVIDAGYDVPTLSRYFDWIAVMTYDFHGNWDKQTGHVAPLYYYPGDVYDYFNANFSMHYWIEKGAPPSKLVMGMPMYGQSFSLADASNNGLNAQSYGPGEAGEFTRAGGFMAFYEICERVKRRSWNVVRDSQGRMGPYAYSGNQWVSYDDIAEIKRKSQLIKDLGLAGGMIWALDLDDFRNRCGCGKHPLLKTLNRELRNIPSDITMQNCT
ncbi:probable chitinase 10 [Harmonia axyridis]|uniref:probable chitinase 10 n=1 Tax=Harmonia axyridis TaxID=115357 RepID=UPI001E276730|nr:probable chitinase 10 [Harmonia axyridis]XP_045475621.1 probable chitinase 10 [Harmonia axyridis]